MAFDKDTRKRLAEFVAAARKLVVGEFTAQFSLLYGIPESGEVAPLESLVDLDDAGRATASRIRDRIDYLVRTQPEGGDVRKAAVDRLAREQAFTIVNRLAAIRMAEKRGIIEQSVGNAYKSQGFKVFDSVARAGLGDTYSRYRRFLFCLFDELAVDLGALFDRRSPQGLLFPREPALLALLKLQNALELDDLWGEDETIGWIYQYYNDPAERKKMRDDSDAPRNSRELAVRNQFFTPRYVVEFLTDNSLGRTWYEMRVGDTALRDTCRYLIRQPTEVFLPAGELAPEQRAEDRASASKEELLKLPVYIPHRALKDPREIRVLDPACGSMHFGLYCFDLLEVIYAEAWDAGLESLRRDFPERDGLLQEVPRLIIEHNIHGIDIDPRAVQIAGLALWLRAQQSWKRLGTKPAQRPRIRRSNIVCAEPMPGEATILAEFLEAHCSTTPERQLIGQLVLRIFDAMKLAGEAGSLLKIEDEIAAAVAEAKQKWLAADRPRQGSFFPPDIASSGGPPDLSLTVTGVTDETFWASAEEGIYVALQTYAEQAERAGGYQRRLFADDAARGFAFIDLCRQRYDVALMNPPFGDASLPSKPYVDEVYGDTRGDVYKAFVECFQARLVPAGYLGIISSRTGFFQGQSADWRTRVVLRLFRPVALADLGMGVLDAMVEVAAYVLRSLSAREARDLTLSLVPVVERVARDKQDRFSLPKWQAVRGGLKRHQAVGELEQLDSAGFIRRCPGDIVRYTPLWLALKAVTAPPAPVFPPLVCIRVLAEAEKGVAIASAIVNPDTTATFVCDPSEFRELPACSFAYWASSRVRGLFTELPKFENDGRTVRQGMATADDGRFLRAWFEVPAESRLNPHGVDASNEDAFHVWCVQQSMTTTRWFPFAKGGSFAPFYQDLSLVGNWHNDGAEIRNFCDLKTGKVRSRPQSTDYYFRPGYTYPLRTSRLSPQVMPAGSLISVRGSGIYGDHSGAFLAVLNSLPFDFLIKMILGRFGHPQFDMGDINVTPIPRLSRDSCAHFAKLALDCVAEKRGLDTTNSTSHVFRVPALLSEPGNTLAERAAAWAARVDASDATVATIQAEIDDLAFRLYGLDAADRAALTATLSTERTADVEAEAGEDEEEVGASADAPALTADLLEYALGAGFGRWDIHLATGQKPALPEPDPFAPLPVCPPGMLQDGGGRSATAADVPADYPLRISWLGVLVDDVGNPEDLELRVREVLGLFFRKGAETIEQEACTLLGAASLREYFRKPSGFFADQLNRYSKCGRQAPIYWPLSTASGSYTLWVYYPRLTDQTLHAAIANFLTPKIRNVRMELDSLGSQNNARAGELRDLLEELTVLRDELERVIKLPWKPNLNDGVLITASPLWKLFRFAKWQKTLKVCWEQLERGEYDWAHLAYSIWPKRVEDACSKDRSIAIAHDREHLCTVAVKPKPKTRAKKAQQKSLLEDNE